MALNIVVTVKQVPDTHNVTGNAMKSDGTVNRAALPAIFNPEDLNALEEAICVKEKCGGRITVITMGPPSAIEVLKESLYRGADEVILISDRRLSGADTLATSYALKCAIEKLGAVDIIFCGRQAIDGDTAQVGPQIAEKLGINQITGVSHVASIDAETITARRSTEFGAEVVRSKFPVLITVTNEANTPRPRSARKTLRYKNVEVAKDDATYEETYLKSGEATQKTFIKEWNVDSICAVPAQCGLSGSPTKVKHIENVILTARDTKQVANTVDGLASLVKELREEHILG
jgi:electron transfer flavoprotein beta subunit